MLSSSMFHSHKGSLDALEFVIRPPGYELPLARVAGNSDLANLDFRFKKAIIHRELLSNVERLPWDLMTKFLSKEYDGGLLSMLAINIVHGYDGEDPGEELLSRQNNVIWRFMLLRAYDGVDLKDDIVNALDTGISVFDKSLDNWDEAANTYAIFVRKIRNIASDDGAVSERVMDSLINLITKVEWQSPGGINQARLIVEIMQAIQPFAAPESPLEPIRDKVSAALWHGLDTVVQVATPETTASVVDLEEAIFEALDLGTKSRKWNSLHAADLENHPRVVAWLVAKVGESPSAARRWLGLMRKFETEWFGSNTSLQQVWIDHKLGWRLLASFRTIENGDDLFLMSPILISLISFETPELRRHLVEAGLIPAVVDMVIRICTKQKRFSPTWGDGVNLVLEMFFQLWEFPESDRLVTDDKMVAAFKSILPILESNLRQKRDTGKRFHSQLLQFAGYIHERRRIPAIISQNRDVALNRLYAECDRKVEWGYHLYGQPKALCCTREDFASDGMF
ncbi:hypothetical protein FRC01_012460 [Tulasnella sp. 417]|nr:hypothetical protein FRC01_012460 [Tulasnella sp. 417]